MAFITGFPRMHRWNDSIWVIVDRMISQHISYQLRLQIQPKIMLDYIFGELVWMHKVPMSIISESDTQFTS